MVNDGFGHLINIALRAPGLSFSTSVIASTVISSTTAMCEPCAEDNHGLFDSLHHLIFYFEVSGFNVPVLGFLVFTREAGGFFEKMGGLMAQFEHLPIYKKAYDLALYFENIVRNFSRYHKYTVGTELRQLSREVLRLIRRANNSFNKAPILEQLRERLEDLKLTIRLCKDLKSFSNFNSYQYSVNEVVNLCKQNEGWLKSVRTGGQPESPFRSPKEAERAD